MALKLKKYSSIQKPEVDIPPTILKAMQGTAKNNKIQDASVKKFIGEQLFDQCEQISLYVHEDHAKFSINASEFNTVQFNPFSDDFEVDANLLKNAVEMAIVDAQTQVEFEAAANPIDPHDNILNDVDGSDSVKLPNATQFYQSVKSTGKNSRYAFIAKQKSGTARLAMRLRGTHVSVRMEPYNSSLKKVIDILGLGDNGNYASAHFEASTDLALTRYWAILEATLSEWDVAAFNKDKIMEVSQ